MADPTLAGTNEPIREVHGYDALDRLEGESADRTPRGGTGQRADSAYDQFWLGEEGFYLGK